MRASSGRLQAAAILVCSSINQPFGEAAMRLAFAASALCLSALGLSLLTQAAQPVTPQAAPATAAPVSAAPTPAATAPSPAPVASDAAAKHVKRTACLKEAKTKKLIGADKTAFLKSCIEAQEPISASRQTPPDRP
jgi:hypothetical protein